MTPTAAIGVLAALVLLATAAGLLSRRTAGRVRRAEGRLTAADVGAASAFGDRATLVQFSTPTCSRCPGTARLLCDLAAARPGVVHVEVDVSRRVDVADRFGVLQTPTTLLLDADGRLRSRVGGAPQRPALERELDAVLGGTA